MKKTVLFLVFFCLGCTSQHNKTNITITLIDSNHSLSIKGFDKAIIADIARDTETGVWQSLLPVYKMPVDTDLKDFQVVQPGQYSVRDSVVVFKPDTPFKKGQAYFLRYYQHDKNTDAWQFIRDKKRPGASTYTDLIFKY
jgi:hypothetical protein